MIQTGRMVGNTTRLVDHYIQEIFEGKTVKLFDHWQSGEAIHANEEVAFRVKRRIEIEHPNYPVVFKKENNYTLAYAVTSR